LAAGADGSIYAYGDATSHGTLPADHVSVADVVGIAATATGTGYWLVGADGGVFAFGSAAFAGSVPGDGIHIDDVKVSPRRRAAGLLDGRGGRGVFAFGVAPFHGSLPGDSITVSNIVGSSPHPQAGATGWSATTVACSPSAAPRTTGRYRSACERAQRGGHRLEPHLKPRRLQGRRTLRRGRWMSDDAPSAGLGPRART